MEMVDAKSLVAPDELHAFMQDLLNQHGETPEQLMVLLLKIAMAKVILEDALELDEPIKATLEKGVEE